MNGVNYGISSTLISLQSLLAHPDFKEICFQFMKSKQLDAFGVMSMYTTTPTDNNHPMKHRELMLVTLSSSKLHQLQDAFFSCAEGDLNLLPLNITFPQVILEAIPKELDETLETCYMVTFTQQDISKSRKQVMPIFHQAIQIAFENHTASCSE